MQEFDPGKWLEPLNPRLAQALREQFEDAVGDCLTRPRLEKPRTLKVLVHVTPSYNPETGEADMVHITPVLQRPSMPPMAASDSFELQPKKGRLFFNQLNPHDARQGLLFQQQADAEAAAKPSGEEARGDAE